MIFLLCSGCRKSIDLIQIPIIFNRIATLSDKYWRFYFFTCTTCIVYQYFKELAAFVSKAGAKVKALFLTTKLFRKFFLFFLFTHFSGSLCERERMYKRKKTKVVFFANRTAKIRTLFIILQNFSEVFFVLFFKPNLAFSLCQFCKAFFSRKAGAKVHPFRIQSKYIKLFFRTFFERIC